MKDNRMDNIVECAYNMDNGYVEVWFTDGNMLRIKCEEVEAALRTTEQSLANLHRLLDNKPIEYVAMALSVEMQAYCDIEDDMVNGMFGTIVQGYNNFLIVDKNTNILYNVDSLVSCKSSLLKMIHILKIIQLD